MRETLPTCLLTALSVLLFACASQPPDVRPWAVQSAEKLERTLTQERTILAPARSLEDLKRALHYYSLADDENGQGRCHIKLAKLHFRLGKLEEVPPHLQSAMQIGQRLNNPLLQYEASLLTARLDNRTEAFEDVMLYAEKPIQRAIVLTYLGRPQEAFEQIQPYLEQSEQAADDYAFVLYHYAEHSFESRYAHKALSLYKMTDNHHGTANSLYLLGQIAVDQGDPAQAKAYFERAMVVSDALGDKKRVSLIKLRLEQM